MPSRYGLSPQGCVVLRCLAGRVIDRPDNLDALANAMSALCDADQRRRCAEAAEGLAERIDMDAHVRALEQVLRDAAG